MDTPESVWTFVEELMSKRGKKPSADMSEEFLQEIAKMERSMRSVLDAEARYWGKRGVTGPVWLGAAPPGPAKLDTPVFACDVAWREQAFPLVMAGISAAYPSAVPFAAKRAARWMILSFDTTWNSYKRGAAAMYFDAVQFINQYGLPPVPAVLVEMTRLATAGLSGQKISGDGRHSDMLRLHWNALVCRLRYEAVYAVLHRGMYEWRSTPASRQDGGPTGPWLGQRVSADGYYERPDIRCMDRTEAFHGGQRSHFPRRADLIMSAEGADRAPRQITRAATIAMASLPKLARSGDPETVARDYSYCRRAKGLASEAVRSHGFGDAYRWPGRFSLPSRRTCELLHWEVLHDAFENFGCVPDDPACVLQDLLSG